MFKKLTKYFKNTTFKEIFLFLVKQSISAVVGFILALLLTNMVAFAISLAIFIFVALIVSAIASNKKLQFDLLSIIKEARKHGHWIEIVRLGFPLSRQLWLSGRYNLRIAIGEFVKEAAFSIDETKDIKIGNNVYNINYIRASVLIDDLGWTKFYIRQNDEDAERNILSGVDIAEKNSFIDLAIKGKRHLIGIYSKKNKNTDVEKMFLEIERLKNNLSDNTKINEIDADLLRSRSICFFMKEQWYDSINYAKNAKEQYIIINNYEKFVETFDLIAEGYIKLHEWNNAEFEITQGLNAAQKWEQNEKYIKLVILMFNLKNSFLANSLTFKESDFAINKYKEMFNDAQGRCKKVENDQLLYELKYAYKSFLILYKKTCKQSKQDRNKKGIIHYTQGD